MHPGQLAHLSAQISAAVLRELLPGGEHRGQVPGVHAGGCRLLPAGGSRGAPARQQTGECRDTERWTGGSGSRPPPCCRRPLILLLSSHPGGGVLAPH